MPCGVFACFGPYGAIPRNGETGTEGSRLFRSVAHKHEVAFLDFMGHEKVQVSSVFAMSSFFVMVDVYHFCSDSFGLSSHIFRTFRTLMCTGLSRIRAFG